MPSHRSSVRVDKGWRGVIDKYITVLTLESTVDGWIKNSSWKNPRMHQ